MRADARHNRERIVEAGRTAFGERGRGVQMDDVARLAGVGVGTLYRHFPRKEDLVLELVRDSVRSFTESAHEALARDDPWEAVEWLVRGKAASMARNRGLRDAISVIEFGDENPWDSTEARHAAEALLSRARDEGAIRSDITVDDWQALMCGLSAAISSGADPDRQAGFLLAALRPPADVGGEGSSAAKCGAQ